VTVGSGRTLHPIHGALLAGTIPLFLGGALSDYAYSVTYQIQWANFASWLIAGALVFGALALLCSIIHVIRSPHRGGLVIIYPLFLLATWILGFINSLVHAKDAWASMPTGFTLSIIVFLLACISTWIGFAKFGVGGAR
jgi:uncharacterized membrane protein